MNLIKTEFEDQILIAVLSRPNKLNALNRSVIGELGEIIDQVRGQDNIKGLLITGEGENAFAAGADISEFQDYPEAEAKLMAKRGHEIFDRIESSPKPVIAAINGFCLGGGLELAMAAHIRVCSANAKFGQPEVNLGIIPGYGGTQRLPQLIGKGKAFELLLTGDMIDAKEAHQLGLVNHVYDKEALMSEAKKLVKKIAVKAPLAVEEIINSVLAGEVNNDQGYEYEIEHFSKLFETEDFKEGVDAFLHKRPAKFVGK